MKRIVAVLLIGAVVLALAGIGLAWARPDLVPSWARLRVPTPAAPADAGLFCAEHGVPEKFCTLCHEELKSTLLLCKEHGDIPEDICTLCHPEVKEKYKIKTCSEHGLPESFCAQCGKGPSAALDLPDDGWCALHNKPEPQCAACALDPRPIGPVAVAVGAAAWACRQPLPVVRLASAKIARQVGIQTAPATEETHAHTLSANAEVAYDANRYAEISPRVGGYLREVYIDLGQVVREGEALAEVDSTEVGAARTQHLSAQAALNLARATAERTQSLARSGAVPGKAELEVMTALNHAQALARDAEQMLRNLGFGDAELAPLLESSATSNRLNVVAPIDGTVVVRHAVRGEAVQPTTRLFAVADTSKMWLWIDIDESDIDQVQPGQAVTFTVSGRNEERAGPAPSGRVTWVGTQVDDKTRTTRVRAELLNPDGRLRANQFGQAEIRIGPEHTAVMVPKAAVQRKEKTDLVFLTQSDGSFRPQRVVTRPTDRGDVIEVTWGLKRGQKVVTQGSFLLKTEIMKGAIGAGCCD